MVGGTRSYEMARRLVAMGHEVSIITSWRETDRRRHIVESFEEGIHVYWIPVSYSNRMGFRDRIIAFLKFAFRSSKLAASLDADIVFATSTPLTIALPAVFASRVRCVPMVFEVRDLWPEMPIAIGALKNPLLVYAARRLEAWAYQNSTSIVALSPGMKKGVLKTGYPSGDVAVIPNSCDNQEFAYDAISAKTFRASRPWLGDNPLLVYAGTFGKVNGVGYAVSLAKELLKLRSNVRILLVGDGSERDIIIDQAKSCNVLNRVLFIQDQLAKCEVHSLFSAATMCSSLFLDIPEMRINSANKFFDGLAAGKPIFLNYGGWMHDIIVKHHCGISAWRTPINEVALEVHSCLNNDVWLESSGRAARMLAERYFDRDFLASQLERVLSASSARYTNRAESIAPGLY